MFLLNENNIKNYLLKINLTLGNSTIKIRKVNRGFISNVFEVTLDNQRLFLKQAIPDDLNITDVLKKLPEGFEVLFDLNRQFVEEKALKICEQFSLNFVPKVIHFDEENHILTLSAVGSADAVLMSDVFMKIMNPKVFKKIGANIALISNKTYGKIPPLRKADLEKTVRKIIYKYEIREVWNNIDAKNRERAFKKTENFISESLNINKVLVFGDFQERNILLDKKDKNNFWTFDLEEAHIGDPIEDVGKLLTSCILKFFFFDEIKLSAKEDVLSLLEGFLQNLQIPEDMDQLQKRLKIFISGCLLFRIDGISSAWLDWKDEIKKQKVRNFSLTLLKEKRGIINLIQQLS